MNEYNIHDFYNIFFIKNPNHFYLICTIIQNAWNIVIIILLKILHIIIYI
jgi:hypothetical protein